MQDDATIVANKRRTSQCQFSFDEAMKILCPLPENRSLVLARRIGINKLGHYMYFEAVRGNQQFTEWSPGRELKDEEYLIFRELLKSGDLRKRDNPRGSFGCFLFSHKDEPEYNVVPFRAQAAE